MNKSAGVNGSLGDRQATHPQTVRDIDVNKVTEIAFHTFVVVGGLIGNLFVAWVVLRRRRMRTPTNWLVFNLAISDLLIVLYVIPLTNLLFFVSWPFGEVGCKYLFMPTSEFPAGVSVLTHTAIALLRYYIVCRPTGSRVHVRTVFMVIVFVWTVAFLTMSATLMGPLAFGDYTAQGCELKFKSGTHKKAYRLLVFSLTYIIPMVATGFAYIKIHVTLRNNFKKIKQLISKAAIHSRLRQSRKMDRTLMMMYVFFACATLPIQLLFMFHDFELLRISKNLGRHLFIVFLALFYTQVITNPLVLFYMGDEFRKELCAFPICCFATRLWTRSSSVTDSSCSLNENFESRKLSVVSSSTRLTRLSSRFSRRVSRISSSSGRRRLSSRRRSTKNDERDNNDELMKSPPNDCYIPLSYFTTTFPETQTLDDVNDATFRTNEGDILWIANNDVHQPSLKMPGSEIVSPRKQTLSEGTHRLYEIEFPPNVIADSYSSISRRSLYDNDSLGGAGTPNVNLLSRGVQRSCASSQVYEETEDSLGSSSGEAVRSEEIYRVLDGRDCEVDDSSSPQPCTQRRTLGTPRVGFPTVMKPVTNVVSSITIKNGELLIDGISRETLI